MLVVRLIKAPMYPRVPRSSVNPQLRASTKDADPSRSPTCVYSHAMEWNNLIYGIPLNSKSITVGTRHALTIFKLEAPMHTANSLNSSPWLWWGCQFLRVILLDSVLVQGLESPNQLRQSEWYPRTPLAINQKDGDHQAILFPCGHQSEGGN